MLAVDFSQVLAIERRALVLQDTASQIDVNNTSLSSQLKLSCSYISEVLALSPKISFQYSGFGFFGGYSRYLPIKDTNFTNKENFAFGLSRAFINNKYHYGRLSGIFLKLKENSFLGFNLGTGSLIKTSDWVFNVETNLLFNLKNKSKLLLVELDNSKNVYKSFLRSGMKLIWNYYIEEKIEANEFEYMVFGLGVFVDWLALNSTFRITLIERLYMDGTTSDSFISEYSPPQIGLSWVLNFL